MKVLSEADTPLQTAFEARSFAFGHLALTFESEDRAFMGYLGQRYPRFGLDDAAASPSSFRFRFRFRLPFHVRFEPTAPTPASLVSPLEARLESVTIDATDRGFELSTPTSHAVVDLEARRATLHGPSAMYPLDNLLRHLLPTLWREGALFHGAALADGESGLLACGPSGAGKSTLAKLAGGHALCDELAGVCRDDDDDDSEAPGHRLVSLPFWASRPGSARLRALLLLEHGTDHHIRPVAPGEALRALSSLLLWPTASAAAMAEVLTHFTDLVTSVPTFRLSFAPRNDVWRFLSKEIL